MAVADLEDNYFVAPTVALANGDREMISILIVSLLFLKPVICNYICNYICNWLCCYVPPVRAPLSLELRYIV